MTVSDKLKINVIGLGYIGLPTAALLASRKHTVIGVDINPKAVEKINCGEIHITEPELDILVGSTVKEGYLRATHKPEPSDAFIVAVPTPFKENYEPDLSYIKAAADSIAPVLAKGNLVILESTSPVGTTEQLSEWLAMARPDLSFPHMQADCDIHITYCPERVLPGHVLRELVQNDRVIGGMTPTCAEKAVALYQSFLEGQCYKTTVRTAEMCKLTENSFRDVNIAFANELSIICDKLDINVWELIALANHHPRVNILKPGAGVGGHCIAVDPWFIVSKTPKEAQLIHAARRVNDSKPAFVVAKVQEAIGQHLQQNPHKTAKDITIACLGLAFKPDIDDLRCSPAIEIAEAITGSHPGPVLLVEPNIEELPASFTGKAELASLEKACLEADIKVVLVLHQEFIKQHAEILQQGYVVDVCNLPTDRVNA